MKQYIIYKYQRRGAPPNKGYIGWTVELPKRDRRHQSLASLSSRLPWSRALRKHGREAFDLVVLETHATKDAARAAEIRLIAEHKTHVRHGGYNSTSGGDGSPDMPEDVKRRWHEAQAIAKACPKYKAHMGTLSKIRWADPEYTARTSAVIKIAKNKPEQKARARHKGTAQWTPEYTAYMSAAARERWADPEFKARSVAVMKAGIDPECKARMGKISSARWADPDYNARVSANLRISKARPEYKTRQRANMAAQRTDPEHPLNQANKIRWADPEARVRQSAAMKAAWVIRRAKMATDPGGKTMAFDPNIPSGVIPDNPNDEFDPANELHGSYPEVALDPEKVAAASYPPEGRELVQEEARRERDAQRDVNLNPDFNPVLPAPAPSYR